MRTPGGPTIVMLPPLVPTSEIESHEMKRDFWNAGLA